MDRAPEFAAVAAFVAALVPWSVSVADGAFAGSIVVRFVFGAVELSFGARSLDVARTAFPVTAVGSQYGGDLARLGTLWLVAAALLVVALTLALVLVVAGDRLRMGAFDPVRAMGALCLGMALVLSGATWLLWQQSSPVPIPIGVIVLFLFGVGLLTVDRTHDARAGAGTSG